MPADLEVKAMEEEFEEITSYLEIEAVQADSIAFELGLQPGDKIIRINGQQLRDFIDYKFLLTDNYLEIEVMRRDQEYWVLEIEKGLDEELGIEFSEIVFDGLKTCANNCLFCFIDQAPSSGEERASLYVKDDDYRFSFLEGSYITLTNLTESELNRIKRLHLSPINISVHSTNPEVRQKMLNNKQAGRILTQIEELVAAGIKLNTQVVLCPGINDGRYLEETIANLGEFAPQIKSLAIVPVGLTKHRDGLPELRSVTPEEAEEVIAEVEEWQNYFRQQLGCSFVYLADEFYLLANREIPSADVYDDFPQLENGVGMVRLFWEQFQEVETELPTRISTPRRVSVVTGKLGEKVLFPVIDRLNQITGLNVELQVIENQYYGKMVTVTGLLTGRDILNQLQEVSTEELVLIPDILLNEEDLFLDNLSWAEFSNQLSSQVKRVETKAHKLVGQIVGNLEGASK